MNTEGGEQLDLAPFLTLLERCSTDKAVEVSDSSTLILNQLRLLPYDQMDREGQGS